MKLREFTFLTDQNIHLDVVAFLRSSGLDVSSARELDLAIATDIEIIQMALAQRRIIITHDSDFGSLTILQGQQFFGILFLRPGHGDPAITVDSLRQLLLIDPELNVPFTLVVKRTGNLINMRIRHA
jgi:predicted nuclease of predicted toxin-antitoxin system